MMTSNAGLAMGRSSAGSVNIVTTTGTNQVHGDVFFDLSISRAFPLKFREGAKLLFRSEFFYAFNRVNLGLPDSTAGRDTFCRISSVDGGPRILQLSLKTEL